MSCKMNQLSITFGKKSIEKLSTLQNLFAEKFAFIEKLSDEEKEAIQHYARVSMIGASTRIENAQLTVIPPLIGGFKSRVSQAARCRI